MHTAPKFFDIHAHINDARFNDDRGEVLARMREHDVDAIVVGTDAESSKNVTSMTATSDRLFASIGVHPIDDQNENFSEPFFASLVTNKRVVAVGECGLDYSRLEDVEDVAVEKTRQRKLFVAQVNFAIAQNLPLMLHVRDSDKVLADAHQDILEILSEKKKIVGGRLRGNVHFFTQTIEVAREYFALDFTISFTGVITFSNEYDDVVRLAPLENIMAETDCPYVTPAPYRGKRNEPIYVEEVVKKIAEIRGEDFEIVRSALVQNAMRVFSIKG